MLKHRPAPNENANQIAKLSTGIGTALAAIWFPPAALAQPLINLLIEKWMKQPEKILIEQIQSNGLHHITDDQLVSFVPMAYRFFEAAKEGEYHHNLLVLGKFIANELKETSPDPANLKKAARCIEGISELSLQVLTAVHFHLNNNSKSDYCYTDIKFTEIDDRHDIAEATPLCRMMSKTKNINIETIKFCLSDLSSRNLLYASPQTDFSRPDEYFYTMTDQSNELIKKALAVVQH